MDITGWKGIVACTPQARWVFDTEPAAFPGLLATAAEPTRFQWHILRSLNQRAIAANSYFKSSYAQSTGINFTSGYRTPVGNRNVGGEANSNHLYGRAFDFAQGSSWGNYYAMKAAWKAGAKADSYLLKADGEMVFLSKYNYDINLLPDPSSVTYIRGHAAWDQ